MHVTMDLVWSPIVMMNMMRRLVKKITKKKENALRNMFKFNRRVRFKQSGIETNVCDKQNL